MSNNNIYQEKAHQYIPAGCHTYSRADDSYPVNAPAVLEKGKGVYVWDMDHQKFIDYGMALRAVTIGYDYKRISNAAITQIHNGNNLTRASKIEIEAAELICNLIPWVEMVKFAKNGSTVTSAALKLARAYTGRKYIARCAQQPFFSYDDWFIGDTIMNSGVPKENHALTLRFNYNNIASLEDLFSEFPNQIAGVILEPATTEEPEDNFLQKVRDLCTKNESILILDEMITGFRWHLRGACQYYNVKPDLVTYGKGMANGFSVAALGGRREIMELGGIHHAKERVFLISTTHGAEMCGLGAFVETMQVYQELNVIQKIWENGKKLMIGMNDIAQKLRVAEYFQVIGLPCSPNFITKDRAQNISLEFRTLFVQEMIKHGVLMPWIAIAYEHQHEIEITLQAVEQSLQIYKLALNGDVKDYLLGRPIKSVFRKFN